jgi:hypothetical protein
MLNEYCDCNPNFLQELNSLPEKYRKKFIQKFSDEKNEIEFLSKISEFRFVQFFVEKGFDFDYEPLIYDKTPDLKIKKGVLKLLVI